MLTTRILLGVLVILIIIGGLILLVRVNAFPQYFVEVGNATRHKLEDVRVYFGNEMVAWPGVLVKGGQATEGVVTTSIPREAVVTWTVNGMTHAPRVKLEGIVPRCPRDMNICFIIEEDGSVTVKAVRNDDIEAGIEALKRVDEMRRTPVDVEDIFYEITQEPAATTGRITRDGGIVGADVDFKALIGNLPVTSEPDGSRCATLRDGTIVRIRGADPQISGYTLEERGAIWIKHPKGKEIEVTYRSQKEEIRGFQGNLPTSSN